MMRLGRIFCLAAFAVAGCAGSPFDEVMVPEDAPSVQAVREDPQRYLGQEVRWGGTIARVDNRPEETCFEVVATDLEGGGRPKAGEDIAGRFIACINRFVDPAVYAEQRDITVIGTVAGGGRGRIGDYPYDYPVVSVERIGLWDEYYSSLGTRPWTGYSPYWW